MECEPTGKRSRFCESHAEEIASSVTHGIGTALSIAGLVLMVTLSGNDPWKVTSSAIFGTTLILLYLSSTLYHSFQNPEVKSFFQILDHSAIYLLIAGSYTPLTLVTLRGSWGWSLFGIVWFMAISGVLIKVLMKDKRNHWISTVIYLLMGWLAVVAAHPLLDALPSGGVILLVTGGLCYTGGVVFYAWKRLRYNHTIWHLFVLAGSTLHTLTMIFYVLP